MMFMPPMICRSAGDASEGVVVPPFEWHFGRVHVGWPGVSFTPSFATKRGETSWLV